MRHKLILNIIVFIYIGFSSQSIVAQLEVGQRSDSLSKDSRLSKIQNELNVFRQNGDINNEILKLAELIREKLFLYGESNNLYGDVVRLETLITENPGLENAVKTKASMYFMSGYYYSFIDNIDEGINYYKIAAKTAKLAGDERLYLMANKVLVGELAKINKKEEGLSLLRLLKKDFIETREFKTSNDSLFMHEVYSAYASFYKHSKLWDSTLYYGKKSLYDKEFNGKLSYRHNLVAESYINLNLHLDSAVYHAKHALNLSQVFDLKWEESLSHKNLNDVYSKLGNFEKAYFHYKRWNDYKDGQKSFRTGLDIGNVIAEEEKEKAKLESVLNQERLNNQQLTIWIVSGGLLLLILGLYYIFNRLKLIRKQNKIIEQEKLRAEQSERYKEQFLANMSHEIRTPMHAISGMINALKRRKHATSQDAYLDAMKISADNLLVILNDVLDMSKIESGSLDIEHVKMNPAEIIQQVVNIFQYKAEEKGLLLKTNIAKDFPKIVIGDPGRLNQVLMNLVSNAIKFTEVGFLEIGLSTENEKIKVSVKDTGQGIIEEESKTIFESFKQGNNITKGKYGGTGLGLSISKQLIELQNGSIWLESIEGQGCTFYFDLPLIISEEDSQQTVSVLTESQLMAIGKKLEGLRVLIAEDVDFNVMVVKDDLQWYIPNVNLTFVENGKLAVEKYKQDKFDVILMDVQMPELNGYEATKEIRQLEKKNPNRKTPIIAMTASLLKNQIDKCYDAGMDAYIPKPYKPEELINTIQSVLR